MKRTHGVASRRRPADVTETRESPDTGRIRALDAFPAPSAFKLPSFRLVLHRSAYFATVHRVPPRLFVVYPILPLRSNS